MLKDKIKERSNKVKGRLTYEFLKVIAKIHLWSCDNEVAFARAEFEKYVKESCNDDEEAISVFMSVFDNVACVK